MLNGLIHRAGSADSGICRIDVILRAEYGKLLTAEHDPALCAIAPRLVYPKMIRAPKHDLPRFAELDLLPKLLNHIEPDIHGDAEALGPRDELGHPFHHRHRLLLALFRIRRAALLRPHWRPTQQQGQS